MKQSWYRPWCIWLSIFAFVVVFGFYGFKQMFFKRPFDWNTWILFCLHSIGLSFLVVMLPCLLLSVLLELTAGSAYTAINCIELAYLYLSGVFGGRSSLQMGEGPCLNRQALS